jgi:hypothetical protein
MLCGVVLFLTGDCSGFIEHALSDYTIQLVVMTLFCLHRFSWTATEACAGFPLRGLSMHSPAVQIAG